MFFKQHLIYPLLPPSVELVGEEWGACGGLFKRTAQQERKEKKKRDTNMYIVAKKMFGTPMEGSDGHVGVLYDVLFDDQSWKVRHLVVSSGDWFDSRQVLLEPEAIELADWPGRHVRLRLGKEAVRRCPSVETDLPVARREPFEPSQVLVSEAYWTGALRAATERAEEGDPHLRTARLLAGAHIHCPDGWLGHVEDFIVDDETWSVRYLVVDTRNWWPGKRVLIEPTSVASICWDKRTVHLMLARDQIEHLPAFDGVMPSEESVVGTA
jgi:uncharacterized protein YrrD